MTTTSNLAALSAAIARDPLDTTVQLVYADCLEESGDEWRAALVRVGARGDAADYEAVEEWVRENVEGYGMRWSDWIKTSLRLERIQSPDYKPGLGFDKRQVVEWGKGVDLPALQRGVETHIRRGPKCERCGGKRTHEGFRKQGGHITCTTCSGRGYCGTLGERYGNRVNPNGPPEEDRWRNPVEFKHGLPHAVTATLAEVGEEYYKCKKCPYILTRDPGQTSGWCFECDLMMDGPHFRATDWAKALWREWPAIREVRISDRQPCRDVCWREGPRFHTPSWDWMIEDNDPDSVYTPEFRAGSLPKTIVQLMMQMHPEWSLDDEILECPSLEAAHTALALAACAFVRREGAMVQ